MTARLVLLGTKGGASQRPGAPRPTSALVQMGGMTAVNDCGLGVTRAILDQGVALTEIDAIFISHMHSDHVLELGALLHAAWSSGLDRPIDVFGPAALRPYLDRVFEAMADDIAARVVGLGRRDLRGLARALPPPGEAGVTIGAATIRSHPTRHPPLTDSHAYRFEDGARSVVITGDTIPDPDLAAFAQGADILVHEAFLPDRIREIAARLGPDPAKLYRHITEGHSPAEEVGQIAALAQPGHLVLTHLIPPDPDLPDWSAAVRRHWPGDVIIARDGMQFDL